MCKAPAPRRKKKKVRPDFNGSREKGGGKDPDRDERRTDSHSPALANVCGARRSRGESDHQSKENKKNIVEGKAHSPPAEGPNH